MNAVKFSLLVGISAALGQCASSIAMKQELSANLGLRIAAYSALFGVVQGASMNVSYNAVQEVNRMFEAVPGLKDSPIGKCLGNAILMLGNNKAGGESMKIVHEFVEAILNSEAVKAILMRAA